jgi:hypothetical protein
LLWTGTQTKEINHTAVITFIVCIEAQIMWPLEKYARWDGNRWHQVDNNDGQLRLLIEVITVCLKITKFYTSDYQTVISSAKRSF